MFIITSPAHQLYGPALSLGCLSMGTGQCAVVVVVVDFLVGKYLRILRARARARMEGRKTPEEVDPRTH